MNGPPVFEHGPETDIDRTAPEVFDYQQAAEQWLGDFLDWREGADPGDYLGVAKELRPGRLGFGGPRASAENLMVRSTNTIDDGLIKSLLSQRKMAREVLKVGEAFYRRGNYVAHREDFFGELSDMGADNSLPELYEKVAQVINIIPESSLERSGFSKLCRTIGGVAFLAVLEQQKSGQSMSGIARPLRAGYDFAVTYPLVDDLVHDSDYLDRLIGERGSGRYDFNDTITHLLTTGSTEEIEIPSNSITDELVACFKDALELFPFDENGDLARALLALQIAQVADATHKATEQPYERSEYVPYIQKAALTRVISLLIAKGDIKELPVDQIRPIMGLGLRTQLHDDLLDLQNDLSDHNITPITSHIKSQDSSGEQINPAELFIDSLFYSLDKDYDETHQKRAARTLLGTAAHAFASLGQEAFDGLDLSPEYKAVVDFIIAKYPPSKIEAKLQGKLDDIALNRSRLNKNLDIYMLDVHERVDGSVESLIASAGPSFYDIYRHALGGSAKRLRPVLTYITGDTFGIDRNKLDELSLADETIHTASLIFDDLPAQDDGSLRRGKEAAHLRFGEGVAQIAALSMIFDAQERIDRVDADFGLEGRLAGYINQSLGKDGLCLGQARDLQTFKHEPGQDITVEVLDEIAHLKTGLAIEMSIVGAAMIGGLSDKAVDCLKEYSYHCGIAFQVKDDLLDSSHDSERLGKTPGLDRQNRKPSYVSELGTEAAEEKLSRHAELAIEAINRLSPEVNTVKFRQIIRYIAYNSSGVD